MIKADNKQTIAHLIRNYLFTTGSWIYGQISHLASFQPIVLTSKTMNLDIFPFEPIYPYQEITNLDGKLGALLRRSFEFATNRKVDFFAGVCREQKAALLHAHFGPEGYHTLPLKRELEIPLITTFYGADISRLPRIWKWRKRYHRLFDRGNLFLAEGSHMAQRIVDQGCSPEKVRLNRLGVDLESIKFVPRQIGEEDEIKVLMASSFKEKKGIPYGIRAFIEAEKSNPYLRLTIIGGATSDSDRHLLLECQELVSKAKLGEKVRFLGYLQYPEYIKEQRKSHIFLAPSITAANGDTEGGAPVSIIEASAAGMPIISTLHCDIPEVVINGESGLLVPERDVPSLAEAILDLTKAPALWRKMGAVGRKHMEESYNVVKQGESLERIYSQLL
jgi:colanic acid/amylovoran biosynthesis glycosyltransferase